VGIETTAVESERRNSIIMEERKDGNMATGKKAFPLRHLRYRLIHNPGLGSIIRRYVKNSVA